MKAVILLGTLKREGISNTETLVEFLIEYLKKEEIETETIKTVMYNIPPGTSTNMGAGDEWPSIYNKLTEADIIIFATPIWWGNYSSETQKAIERLDEVNDIIRSGNPSPLADKVVGVVITGDSDGSQHIIGTISNFINGLGMYLPPYASLSVQMGIHSKTKNPTQEELREKYEEMYAETAETMARSLARFTKQDHT